MGECGVRVLRMCVLGWLLAVLVYSCCGRVGNVHCLVVPWCIDTRVVCITIAYWNQGLLIHAVYVVIYAVTLDHTSVISITPRLRHGSERSFSNSGKELIPG